MNSRRRLTTVLIALLLPGLLLVYWNARSAGAARPFDEHIIGQRLGGRVIGDVRVWSKEIIEVVRPDQYLLRRYDAPGRAPIWTYVAFYYGVGKLGAGAHDPALCYPAQGWDVLDSQTITIPLEDGTELDAEFMRALREGRQQLVLHWVQPANRQPAVWAKEQILRIGDALSGEDQYAFVRLSIDYEEGGRSREELVKFAQVLAPRVKEAVASAREG